MAENDSVTESVNHESMNLEYSKKVCNFQAILINGGKKVLELDTDGLLTEFLKKRGCNVTRLKINSVSSDNKKDYADKIIEANMSSLDLSKYLGSEKYDVILMDDLLTRVPDVHKFLLQLREFLEADGYIVFSIPNVAHGSVRISLLNGEFNYEQISSKTPQLFFTLDTVLSMIEDSGYSLIQLYRIEKEIDTQMKNYSYTIPEELVDSILRDSESKTTHYVLKVSPTSYQDLEVRKWLREFPKTITSERLKEFFQYYKEHYGGAVLKSLQAADARIAELESEIKKSAKKSRFKFFVL